MNLLLKYIRQRCRVFMAFGLFAVIFAISFLLYDLPVQAVLYPMLLCAAAGIFALVCDFIKVKREHNELCRIKSIDDAYTADYTFEGDILGEDYRDIIRRLSEEHFEYKSQTGRQYSDMVDYYTVWAHQIKTPIASMRLTLQNEDSALSRKLTADLCRVEQYVEMVLTFLRLNSESTDYIFKEYDLDTIVKSAVKKFSYEFITRKLTLVYEPLNTRIVTDERWLSFVIEQVLSNALKYTPSGSITISLVNGKTLRIKDTGIGIAASDLPRIFENGYTGYNGRMDKKSSGIGLYLCRRICANLGHTISAESVVDKGTAIDINLAQTKIQPE